MDKKRKLHYMEISRFLGAGALFIIVFVAAIIGILDMLGYMPVLIMQH